MNNNQFKREVRETIEQLSKDNQLKVVYIDTSSNARVYYFYCNIDLSCLGTIEVWLGNNNWSIRTSLSSEKVVSLANYDISANGTFLQLDKLVNTIKASILATHHRMQNLKQDTTTLEILEIIEKADGGQENDSRMQ